MRSQVRAEFYELYGSILFVGIFFIILFLTATVLIIYYKQITEGYDDRERFGIMEKVGMSAKEVKRTITRPVSYTHLFPVQISARFPVAVGRGPGKDGSADGNFLAWHDAVSYTHLHRGPSSCGLQS